MKKYILALDQGTTSSRAILFDHSGNIVSVKNKEFTQYYPQAGWVEHDPMEILASQKETIAAVFKDIEVSVDEVAAIGITNQRETTVVWDKNTGIPIYNAIVWQCRRTADYIETVKKDIEFTKYVQKNTGLVLDAYFSGTKIRWILENVPGARDKAEAGELIFGTTDTWLIWNLSKEKAHITDHTNASRTLIYNIKTLEWDEKILKQFDIPKSMLPEVHYSSQIHTNCIIDGVEIPISGIAGDQQAALFGQAGLEEGMAKNTYGTGCFLLMHTGEEMIVSEQNLLTTMACSYDGTVYYALEGSVFIAGAAIQWLRDELEIIDNADETEALAMAVPDSYGVYVVPAFVGLGAPYWDSYARGIIVGLTRGTNRKHLVRATLESIAYQTRDLIAAMEKDSGITLSQLKVDGGATANNFLMQFQSNILQAQVQRPVVRETTALGAAYLAGLAVGFWKNVAEIRENWQLDKLYTPIMTKEDADKAYYGWELAVGRSRHWLNS